MLRDDLYKPWFADKERWGFEVLSGDFQGVIIQLEELKFEQVEQKSAIGINYHVIHKPEIIPKEDMKNNNFQSLIDTVVNDILNEAMENYEQHRINDTNEPGSQ
tara:strand:+ start:121 stop:432 length:312 start_codon:yes stop_codon:yes gene_type:complete